MAIQFAKAPYSVHWKDWLLSHLFPAEFSKAFDRTNLLGKTEKTTFDETYETDGVDASDGSYSLAYDPESANYFNPLFSTKESPEKLNFRREFYNLLLQVFTMMGLPTRANAVLDRQYLFITFKQFGKNLIGGWDSDPNISKEKKIWQWASLPIKIAIILPWKIITFPFKFMINGAKIFTEWLPLFFASLFAAALGAYRSTNLGIMHFPDSDGWTKNPVIAILATLFVALFKIPHLILGTLYFAFRLIALIGRTITSPLKSARMAFRYGRELKVSVFSNSEWGQFFNRLTSNLIGVLGLTISMSMTALFWVIMLPSATVSAVSYICTAYPWTFELFSLISQLPPIVAATTWFTPIVTATFSFLNPLGIALTQVFGTAMASFGAFIGIQLSMAYTITGSALALIAAVVAPALTLVGEVLSNRWATWTNGGPVTTFLSLFSPKTSQKTTASTQSLEATPLTHTDTLTPLVDQDDDLSASPTIPPLLDRSKDALIETSKALATAERSLVTAKQKAPHQRFQEGKLAPTPDFAKLYRQETAYINCV